GRPQEALLCAKAKRQQQSTQSERRSTPRFEKRLYFLSCHLDVIDIIVFQQHDKPGTHRESWFVLFSLMKLKINLGLIV
ncbi:hypothetical protein, partial [Lysinibacillus sp. NPDC096215]|uniref:hypothetical protein n=1 Tax=Lysinibacillus sp. NPDC096215 TaxID=3390582 RepID=UPI003D091ED2